MNTGLLVSVRDRDEALQALAAGADLIDLKEPSAGALGPVDPLTMQEIVRAVDGRATLSAAVGELLDWTETQARNLPRGLALAKFGLAGCGDRDDWPARLADAVGKLPAGTRGVAVLYADGARARAPAPAQVVAQAARAGCRAVLIDTCYKDRGGLVQLWDLDACRDALRRIRAAGLWAVLGGSLGKLDIARLLPLAPDFLAVRGAVCSGPRTGPLRPELVRELVELVHAGRRETARSTA